MHIWLQIPILTALFVALHQTSVAALECGDPQLDYTLTSQSLEELFENGEGQPGPRRLVIEQTSTIISLGGRRFIQATPLDIDKLTLDIEKITGSPLGGETAFVLCKTNSQGQSVKLDEFTLAGPAGLRRSAAYEGLRDQRLTLRLEGRSLLGQARFRIALKRPRPVYKLDKTGATPVPGFADLHNHQAAQLAYAGGWYWGSHREGDLHTQVPACSGDNHATLRLPFRTPGESLIDPHPALLQGAPDYGQWPSWKDIKHQQVAAQWLEQAHRGGLNLIVASLVNNQWMSAAMIASGHQNPAYSPADMESVKRQIISLKEMDAATPWYTIVTDPWQARRAIARGELAVVLAIEVSDLMPASDGPWQGQLDELYDMGVRALQLAHETNSRFSGAAYHRDLFKVLSHIKARFDPRAPYAGDGDGLHNPIGLTQEGYALIEEMIKRNMLIDLAHLPLLAQRQIYRHLAGKHRYYPLFNSHTRMDALLRPAEKQVLKEFVTTDETLEYVRSTGGILGLRTGEDPMLSHTPKNPALALANNCDGSVRSWLQFYQYADDLGASLAFGSDFNGFITQFAPRFGPDACANAPDPQTRQKQRLAQGLPPTEKHAALAEFDLKGLAHVGLLPAALKDMQRLGADTANLEHSAEAFIRMWERTYDTKRSRVPLPAKAADAPM